MRRRTRGPIALAALGLVAALLWTACGDRQVRTTRADGPGRVLLIGVDGLDWERVERLVAEGKMPNVAALERNGASGVLRSIYPYRSPSIWTSIATGKTEEKHGVSGFLAYGFGGADDKLASSNLIKAETIWRILSAADRTVGVIGWLVTYPAVPVNGYMVSSLAVLRLATTGVAAIPDDEFEGLRQGVYPPELWDEMRGVAPEPAEVPDEELVSLLGSTDYLEDREVADRLERLRELRAGDLTSLNLGRYLFSTRPTDFTAIYFRGNDIVSHFFWRYMEPDSWGREKLSPEAIETLAPVIDRYYEKVDELIGDVLEFRDDETLVIVCSDHGFAGHRGYPGFNGGLAMGTNMHREQGLIILEGPGIVPGAAIEDASPLDVTPTILVLSALPIGRDMDGVPLSDAMDPSFLEKHPVTFIDTYEAAASAGGEEPVESPIDEEMKAMLRSLGYIN